MTGDGLVHVVGRRLLEGEGDRVRLHQHVDQVEGERVVEVGWEAPRARQVGVHLDEQEPIGVLAGADELRPRRPRVERQVHPAVPVGRCRLRDHDARRELGQDRRHLAEGARHELDPVARRVQQPFRRAEEAAAVAHAGSGEDLVEVEAQRTAELEVLPLLDRTECRQERVGIGGPEPESDGVGRPDEGDGLLDGTGDGHGPLSRCAILPGHGPVKGFVSSPNQ